MYSDCVIVLLCHVFDHNVFLPHTALSRILITWCKLFYCVFSYWGKENCIKSNLRNKCINYYLVCEAIGTAATPGLLCQPRLIVKMIVEKQMECRLAGETEVLGEKTCPSATFVHHKIPHDQTRVWARAAAVGSRRLTAWAMARPGISVTLYWKRMPQ
jgi:hypothetical protein